MERLSIISNQLANTIGSSGSKLITVDSAIDYLGFPALLEKSENDVRIQVREWLAKNIAPTINEYV
jgi:acyl-CoA oxidase